MNYLDYHISAATVGTQYSYTSKVGLIHLRQHHVSRARHTRSRLASEIHRMSTSLANVQRDKAHVVGLTKAS